MSRLNEQERPDKVHGLVGDPSESYRTLSETGSSDKVRSGRSSGIWPLQSITTLYGFHACTCRVMLLLLGVSVRSL